MILSVSRRTDIPAFYTKWFFNRLNEGYVLVRNPMNYHQVSKVKLTPDVIDCIVFWTKDPTNIIKKLDDLKNYKYYFQVTINPYNKSIEKNVSNKKNVIDAFKILSKSIGKNKVIWRYDPIILTKDISISDHEKYFEILASKLSGYTNRCVISFIDYYKKTERNMKSIKQIVIDKEKMLFIGEKLSKIANKYDIMIQTCSERIDLSSVGIEHGKCIDDKLISSIVDQQLYIDKDKNQREACNCVTSIDIGTYNTCKHGCLYCYANFSEKAVSTNILKHDANSPMLIGNIEPKDKITDRKMVSYLSNQVSLF